MDLTQETGKDKFIKNIPLFFNPISWNDFKKG